MSAKLPLKHSEITEPVLLKLYELFCRAYGIEANENDEKFLKSQGLEELNKTGRLDYSIGIGTKFLGQKTFNGTLFFGYISADHSKNETCGIKFVGLVREYVSRELTKSS